MPKEPRASSATPSSRRAPSIGPAPRTASTTWTPEEDEVLMRERAHGSNWGPISAKHFPTKTPNACRKRHERLMERRRDEDWDEVKLENLATQYMEVRREMWGMLANRIGEKFAVVEQKCMEKGVKNLQHLARLAEKREKDDRSGQINTTFGDGSVPLATGFIPSSSSYPPSSSTRPPRDSLGSLPDDSGIELSNNDIDTSDEFSPPTTRSVRGASGSSIQSIQSSFPSSRRASTVFAHPPLPPGMQQQTPGQSPELVQRGKAGSIGSASAIWSSLPAQNAHMQPGPPQHDLAALHRGGSLPSIHSIISSRPGAPAFSHP
ncbi:MAG: hypothetical protein M1822_000598 [Bathelium mastoideum]|nr:MAG: hypothetical protein M1822_000598 [Bathelium mastoideum]